MRRFLLAAADHAFLWRPVLLTPVWAAFLLGARAARVHAGPAPDVAHSLVPAWRLVPPVAEWSGLLAVTLLTASLYIVNQVADVEIDAANGKLFILPRGAVSRRAALAHAAILGAAVLALAAVAGSPECWLFALAALTGLAYSLPPVRAKGRAGFDALANGLCYGAFSFLLGWCAIARDRGDAPVTPAAVACALPYVFASAALVLLSTLEDEAGDRAGGLRTSAVAWGARRVRALTLLLAVLAGISGAVTGEWPAILWAAVSVPAYAAVLHAGGGPARGFRVNQLAGRFLVLLAAPEALVLLAVIAGLVLASRVYYARRFGLRYPRLTLEPSPIAERRVPAAGT